MEDRFKIWKMDSPILIDEYFFKRYFLIRKNAWIKNRRKKFFTTQVGREKLSQKIVQRFFDEKFFCMNKLMSSYTSERYVKPTLSGFQSSR